MPRTIVDWLHRDVPVTDDERVVAVITRADFRRVAGRFTAG